MPEPTMPPITSMVASKRPIWRSRCGESAVACELEGEAVNAASGKASTVARDIGRHALKEFLVAFAAACRHIDDCLPRRHPDVSWTTESFVAGSAAQAVAHSLPIGSVWWSVDSDPVVAARIELVEHAIKLRSVGVGIERHRDRFASLVKRRMLQLEIGPGAGAGKFAIAHQQKAGSRAVVPRVHAGRGMRACRRCPADLADRTNYRFDLLAGNASRSQQYRDGLGQGKHRRLDAHAARAAVENVIHALAQALANVLRGGG